MGDTIQDDLDQLLKTLTTGGPGIPPYNPHYIEALQSTKEFLSGKNVDAQGFAIEKQRLTDLHGALNSNLFPQKDSAALKALSQVQEAVSNTEKSNQLFDVSRAIYQCQKGNGGDQHLTPYKDSLDRVAHAYADSAKSGKPVQMDPKDVEKINDLVAKAKNGEEPALVNLIDHGHGHNWMHNNERGGFVVEVGAMMKDAGEKCVVTGGNSTQGDASKNKAQNSGLHHGTNRSAVHHTQEAAVPPIDPGLHAPSKIAASIRETANLKAPVIDPNLRMAPAAAPVIDAQQTPAPIIRQAPPVASPQTPEQAVACAPGANGAIDVANLRGDDLKNYLKSKERQQKEADKETDHARKDAAKEEKAEAKEAKKERKAEEKEAKKEAKAAQQAQGGAPKGNLLGGITNFVMDGAVIYGMSRGVVIGGPGYYRPDHIPERVREGIIQRENHPLQGFDGAHRGGYFPPVHGGPVHGGPVHMGR